MAATEEEPLPEAQQHDDDASLVVEAAGSDVAAAVAADDAQAELPDGGDASPTHPAESEESMRARHQTDIDAVDADLQEKLSHVGKKNRKKKKALWAEADAQKAELAERHQQELVQAGFVSSEGGATADGASAAGASAEPDAAAVAAKQPPAKPKKKSKSQRRKERKAAEERARAAQLRAEASQFVSGRDVEMQALNEVLAREGLRIHDIAADGNCLYRAVAHQLATTTTTTTTAVGGDDPVAVSYTHLTLPTIYSV